MDKDLLARGLQVRKEVLGKEYVENAMKTANGPTHAMVPS